MLSHHATLYYKPGTGVCRLEKLIALNKFESVEMSLRYAKVDDLPTVTYPINHGSSSH